MEDTLARLGYAGVLLGTFLEGETTILLAAIFAKFGYLDLRHVMLCSFIGTFLGDCSFFFSGKIFGRSVVERYDFLRNKAIHSNALIDRYPHVILFVMRFLAGFRSIILLLLGCADLKASRFLAIDLFSSLVWSVLISLVGFTFANVAYLFVSDVKGYEKIVMTLALAAAVAAIPVYRHLIRKKEEQLHGD